VEKAGHQNESGGMRYDEKTIIMLYSDLWFPVSLHLIKYIELVNGFRKQFVGAYNYALRGIDHVFIIHRNISSGNGVFSFLHKKEYELNDKKRDD